EGRVMPLTEPADEADTARSGRLQLARAAQGGVVVADLVDLEVVRSVRSVGRAAADDDALETHRPRQRRDLRPFGPGEEPAPLEVGGGAPVTGELLPVDRWRLPGAARRHERVLRQQERPPGATVEKPLVRHLAVVDMQRRAAAVAGIDGVLRSGLERVLLE